MNVLLFDVLQASLLLYLLLFLLLYLLLYLLLFLLLFLLPFIIVFKPLAVLVHGPGDNFISLEMISPTDILQSGIYKDLPLTATKVVGAAVLDEYDSLLQGQDTLLEVGLELVSVLSLWVLDHRHTQVIHTHLTVRTLVALLPRRGHFGGHQAAYLLDLHHLVSVPVVLAIRTEQVSLVVLLQDAGGYFLLHHRLDLLILMGLHLHLRPVDVAIRVLLEFFEVVVETVGSQGLVGSDYLVALFDELLLDEALELLLLGRHLTGVEVSLEFLLGLEFVQLFLVEEGGSGILLGQVRRG